MPEDSQPHQDTVVSHGGGSAGSGVPLPPGTAVAGYRVEEVAGRGGMGIVYRARDTELGRAVALKLIAPGQGEDPAFRAMFVRESMAAAALEHPNVLPVYRAGEDDGRLFIAMRFVEGASLQELIGASPGGLPPGRAARIVARVADALDAAHARGLVHRDVKPANILVADPDGEEHVYLSDFGLSTAGARAGGETGWVGTPGYLAPEQIRGEAVDARTDVYALGCVLHHALTGHAPFGAADTDAVLAAHLAERPPVPSAEVPGLPPGFDVVVARAMAKDPAARYASAGELARAALAARYDVALLVADADRAAAETLAGGLRESGLLPLVVTGADPRAAEGVRASGSCAVLVGRHGLGDWARDGLAAARALEMRDRAFRLACVLLPGAPDAADPGLAYLAESPCVDLRAGVDDPLAAADVARLVRGGEVPAGRPRPGDEEAPYRGLEAFREEDAELYVGREQDVARVLEHLRGSRFVAVLGPSGSGKSSLVQAGVLPAVRRDGVTGGRGWRIVEVLPGPRPLASLAAQLGHLAGAGAPSAADLATDERALDMAAARALAGRPEEERVLVLVDQLEEVFTLCGDEGEREAFLGNLVYAATIPGGRAVVVVTMRADFYHRLAEHPGLRTLVASQQVLLGPIDARGLRRVIEEPARRQGLELEPGLTRRILSDVSDRPGTLPLLEHLLLELWRRRRDRTLTLEAYAASGGVEGALARRANEVYGALPPERQAIARRVLLRLTQPGEGTEDTRRRATRAELVTQAGEEAEVDAVVEALAEARLVTTGRDDATGEPVVEVTHEALIRGWPELRGWIDEDRDRLRAERRLSDAASEWDRGGRDDGALYRGARLAEWEERSTTELTPLERDFLAAGRVRAGRERKVRRRRIQATVGGLAAVAVVVAGLGAFALVQRNEAADERDTALSRQLAGSSVLVRDQDPELSVLLAQEAYADAPTREAEEALRQAVHESQVRGTLRFDSGFPSSVTALDGDRVAILSEPGDVTIWNPAADPDGAAAVPLGSWPGGLIVVRETPIGILGAGTDGAVLLWRGDEPGEPEVLGRVRGTAWDVRLSDDRDEVLVASDGGLVTIDVAGGTVRRITDTPVYAAVYDPSDPRRYIAADGDFALARWSADGTAEPIPFDAGAQNLTPGPGPGQLAVGASDGVHVLRVGGSVTEEFSRPVKAGVNAVAFSDDGDAIAVAGADGTARVYAADGDRLAVLNGHTASLGGVAFTDSGLVSAANDSTARLWDWRQGTPERLAGTTATAIGGAAFIDADRIRVVGGDGAVAAWTPPAQEVVPEAGGTGDVLTAAAIGDDGLVADATIDGDVRIRRLGPAPSTAAEWAVGNTPWVVALSPDGTRAAAGLDGGDVVVGEVGGGEEPTVVGSHESAATAVRFGPDGVMASGGRDGEITLYDAAGTPKALGSHDGQVLGLAFSDDGRLLASSGADGTVRVWDLTGGGDPVILRGHDDAVYSVAWVDGGRLVSGSIDQTLRVWDWRRGTTLLEEPVPFPVTTVSVSGDAPRIAAVGLDGTVAEYACDVCGAVAGVQTLAAERTSRELTDIEKTDYEVGGD